MSVCAEYLTTECLLMQVNSKMYSRESRMKLLIRISDHGFQDRGSNRNKIILFQAGQPHMSVVTKSLKNL